MYDLPYHKECDERIIAEFVAEHPFAFLTGCDAQGRPVATQVPLLMGEQAGRRVLRGHFMRNTDHHKAFLANEHALVVFAGSHSYVSGAWYQNPHTPSTWNYLSVHAVGAIRFLDGTELEKVLQQTSLHFENNDPDSPTVFANLPDKFKQQAMKMLVAFEIEVTKIDSVFKLSQDRDAKSYLNVIRELSTKDHNARVIAAEMGKRKDLLFPELAATSQESEGMAQSAVASANMTDEYFFREGCFITEWWNKPEDGEASVVRARVEPGMTTRRHCLHGIVERYVILEGHGVVEVGDLAPKNVGPGDVVFIPAGRSQRISNTGDRDLVFLAVCTPRFTPSAYEDLEPAP